MRLCCQKLVRAVDLVHVPEFGDQTPDALARLCAQGELDLTSYTEARRLALPQAEVLVQALRDSVASISSQSELAHNLINNEITGPAYLAEIAEEEDTPLLMLSPPAS